ncbi:MAG TPA: hypothetical protein VL197_01525 [Nitrospirota bacterium]|nr:hypothetical protein [Nitrospirota bacterium]
MKGASEEMRIRYLYRRLIVSGKVRLSLEAARGLVGPDCAYHLYGVLGRTKKKAAPFTPLTRSSRNQK